METLFWNSWGVAFSSFKQPVVCFLIERPSTWVMGLLTVFLQWGQLGGVCQYWSSLSQHLLQRSLVRVVTGMMRWWGKVLHMTMSYQYSSQHQWVIDNSTIWAEEYLQFCFLQETKTKRGFPGNLCIMPRAIWAAQYTPCSVFVVTFLEDGKCIANSCALRSLLACQCSAFYTARCCCGSDVYGGEIPGRVSPHLPTVKGSPDRLHLLLM